MDEMTDGVERPFNEVVRHRAVRGDPQRAHADPL